MGKRTHNVAKTSLQGPFEAEVGGLPQFRLLVQGRAFIRESYFHHSGKAREPCLHSWDNRETWVWVGKLPVAWHWPLVLPGGSFPDLPTSSRLLSAPAKGWKIAPSVHCLVPDRTFRFLE